MNRSMIGRILGYVLIIEAVLMLLPCVVALIYQEREGYAYLITAAACMVLGLLIRRNPVKSHVFYLKEGCVATALSWIVMSLFGAIPFVLTGEIPNYIDALFETVSGFTTTGSSILSDVEALSHCSIFWRSFTHWIGGMGVLVFLLAVIPLSGGSTFNLMRAESPGPSVGKLVPKVKHTARLLYEIYLFLTVVEIVLLLLSRMPLFDSLTLSFGTAGTGGFGIKNDSVAGYTATQQWIIAIFMILFGVNFNAYFFILYRKIGKAFHIQEVRAYFLIILVSVCIISRNLIASGLKAGEGIRTAVFQVGSIITTTGYSTANFDHWSSTCKTILVLLMFIGACAGSTGGGIKVSRILVLLKTVGKELNSFIHPKSIKKIKMDDKPVEHEVVRATNVFMATYIIVFCVSVFCISAEGYDLTTNFTAVAATLNNIGPGLSLVGPAANFGFFDPLSKCVMIFDMLAGRLELFPLLILFHPGLWREAFSQRRSAMLQEKDRRKMQQAK